MNKPLLIKCADRILTMDDQRQELKGQDIFVANGQILEIGCGWGGFAEYLGKNYNVKLDCITISLSLIHI